MKTNHKWVVTWGNGKGRAAGLTSELKKVGNYWRCKTKFGTDVGWQNFTRAKWAIIGSGGTLKKVAA